MAPARETPSAPPNERRRFRRYPVGLNLRYKVRSDSIILEEGSGTTRDVSNGGVLFYADQSLAEGLEVELCIDWPVKIDGAPCLRVIIAGQIVRRTESGMAVKIGRSEFRMNSGSAPS